MTRITVPWVLGLVALLVGCSRGDAPPSEGAGIVGRLAEQKAEMAWMGVDATYGGIYDAGFASYTATQLAELMARTGNAAESAPDPSEFPEGGGSKLAGAQPPSYVVGPPTGPWQISLVPDDANRVVHVALYGPDPKTALKTADYSAR